MGLEIRCSIQLSYGRFSDEKTSLENINRHKIQLHYVRPPGGWQRNLESVEDPVIPPWETKLIASASIAGIGIADIKGYVAPTAGYSD